MTTKINRIICAAAIVCGFASCSDYLDVKPLDEIVLANFWNEESDVENMLAGCYSAMQTEDWLSRAIIWGEVRSENLTGGQRITDDTSLSNVVMENLNSNNKYSTWGSFYNVINRCNTIVAYAPQVAQRDPNYTESELRATVAEASALRDLCYFYLIRAFRDVPYTTVPYIEDTQQMAQPATPFADVLDSLVTDLERVVDDAVLFYPETKPEYQTCRITQDAIHAMLCDMYLWKQDYQKAIDHADVVIASKQRAYREETERLSGNSASQDKLISGYPLISDASTDGNTYGRAFTQLFSTGNSSESIFELLFVNDETRLSNYAVSKCYGSNDKGNGWFSPSDVVAKDVSDGQWQVFLNRYDVRAFENIYDQGNGSIVAKYASQIANVNVTNNPFSTSGQSARWPQDRCYANWIVYRLTDVMLMKAEALVMLTGDNDGGAASDNDNNRLRQAFTLADAVNRRSYANAQATSALTYTRYSSKSAMLNLVYDERNRELMFEGKRWFDLVRRALREGNTNYLISQVGRKYTSNKTAAESKLSKLDAIFWPYNEEELKVNPFLIQNPAFGSGDKSTFEVAQ